MPKSNISKFASLRTINGRVWVHTLLGLRKKRGDEDAPGQPPEGLRHRFCYPEPDRRVHPNPTGIAVTDGTSSSSPVSIPASFCSTRNAAKAAVRLLAPLPKMCPMAEEAVGGPRLPPARREDALPPPGWHPDRQDWVSPNLPWVRLGTGTLPQGMQVQG